MAPAGRRPVQLYRQHACLEVALYRSAKAIEALSKQRHRCGRHLLEHSSPPRLSNGIVKRSPKFRGRLSTYSSPMRSTQRTRLVGRARGSWASVARWGRSKQRPVPGCDGPGDDGRIRGHVRGNGVGQPAGSVHEEREDGAGQGALDPALVHEPSSSDEAMNASHENCAKPTVSKRREISQRRTGRERPRRDRHHDDRRIARDR